MLFGFLLSILQDKLRKMNNVMKEIHQLSSINDINIRYKMHIENKYIIIKNYYNKNHFVQHLLQITRYV